MREGKDVKKKSNRRYNEISEYWGGGDGTRGVGGGEASGGFAVTQSQGVNQPAGQSAVTQMGLHADGAASSRGVNHSAPLYLEGSVCCCLWVSSRGNHLCEDVCVCVFFLFVHSPLPPDKQVLHSASFICMWWPLSLWCCSHAGITGRGRNHIAVYHHCSTIGEGRVPHIWFLRPRSNSVYKHKSQAVRGI